MAKQKTKEGMDPTSQLTSFLKQNKDDHFNFEESVDFSVTQGSLLLDLHVGKIPQESFVILELVEVEKLLKCWKMLRIFYRE
tara:strand:- start:7653 stop:7898 length:246 start_codon:yes stop_codon:yes gene_type:complete